MQSRVSSKHSIDDSCHCFPQCQLLLETCRQWVRRRVRLLPPWDMVVKSLTWSRRKVGVRPLTCRAHAPGSVASVLICAGSVRCSRGIDTQRVPL